MAHQCKVRNIPIDSNEPVEDVFEFALHTTYTKDGIIVLYLDENWEKQIKVYNVEQVLTIHTR